MDGAPHLYILLSVANAIACSKFAWEKLSESEKQELIEFIDSKNAFMSWWAEYEAAQVLKEVLNLKPGSPPS